jgi:hypothetical protein
MGVVIMVPSLLQPLARGAASAAARLPVAASYAARAGTRPS